MAIFGGTGNPHHRRMPRDARHIARRMLRVRGYHRASVLNAQVGSLEYAVNRQEQPNLALPGTENGLTGQRVRIGVEARQMLHELVNSRNLRHQQALVKEINYAILRRIRIHTYRSHMIRKVRERTTRASRWTFSRPSRVRDAMRSRAQKNWQGKGRATRTVGGRAPAAARTRAVPAGGRAPRSPAARTTRTPATRK